MDWTPKDSFCCLIGAGDSGKSTILDAAEAVLSSRWFSFSEADFLECDTSNPIEIEATIGELSKTLKSDERFGLYVRGWTTAGALRDEPEDNDEPVLTIRLSVDATLEPVWELVCDRAATGRVPSNRDRALFGLVRLAGEDARHLAWGQGSVLSRLTGDTTEAAARLADAYRVARESAKLGEIESLARAASSAESFAKSLGAYVAGQYRPGLELGRSGLSSGAIALHDGNVPLRLAGLGTRRLATLAIQKSAIAEGAIVLVDEIEHGLEPHRIMGAISQLKAGQSAALDASLPIGQVLLTTHSEIALAECGAVALHVVRTCQQNRATSVLKAEAPLPIAALMRFTPRAFFARRVVVCEGMTEVGLLLGVREHWTSRKGIPMEQMGVALADGNGAEAPKLALALATLGYPTALFMDSDVPLPPAVDAALNAAGVAIYEYGSGLNTEKAVFTAASDQRVHELLCFAMNNHTENSVCDALMPKIHGANHLIVRQPFGSWPHAVDQSPAQLKAIVAEVAKNKKWFKELRFGREIGTTVWGIMCEDHHAPLTRALLGLEAWVYA